MKHAASSHARKDNGMVRYVRTSTFHVRIEETSNREMALFLTRTISSREGLGKIKQYFHALQECMI